MNEKFYNLIKKKVKFDGNICSDKCLFVNHSDWCNLFDKILNEKINNDFSSYYIRCRQCKTYFGK